MSCVSALALWNWIGWPGLAFDTTCSTCILPPCVRSRRFFGTKRKMKLFGRRALVWPVGVAPPMSSTIHRLPSESAWMPSNPPRPMTPSSATAFEGKSGVACHTPPVVVLVLENEIGVLVRLGLASFYIAAGRRKQVGMIVAISVERDAAARILDRRRALRPHNLLQLGGQRRRQSHADDAGIGERELREVLCGRLRADGQERHSEQRRNRAFREPELHRRSPWDGGENA